MSHQESTMEQDRITGDAPGLPDAIAIVGWSGRFPGASGVEELWRNLLEGVESVASFSEDELRAAGVPAELLGRADYVRGGAVLDGVEELDAAFFGLSPREAELMDPQHRLFLEQAWCALEDAGYDPRRFSGRIGIWGGAGAGSYLVRHLATHPGLLDGPGALQAVIGNDKDFLATRVAYKLDLRGPAVTVQTACSTSLVAVSAACQSLLDGECDMALAGGVTVRLPHRAGYLYQEEGILSPDGHCRAFDAGARGTVPGSGVALVALRRLSDALADGDPVRAVIRGWAVNNDGANKVGYTAPSVEGQAAVVLEALEVAGVEPDSIGYVEAHGTGTRLGDPIEVAALTRAFAARGGRREPCRIGSVKTNIGHLDGAAGVAGLLKAALAVGRGRIPATLHFRASNPGIDFATAPFQVVAETAGWTRDGGPRRAGVSSFGIGGTNAHVVLEEPPAPAPRSGGREPSRHVLPVSARSEAALEAACRRLADHLEAHPELPLADAAWTLQAGRVPFAHRRAVVAADRREAIAALRGEGAAGVRSGLSPEGAPPVAFLLPGQGAQHGGMAAALYRELPGFREELDRCCALLEPHLGLDLRPLLLAEGEAREEAGRRLRETALAQPALFAVEHALARLWISWGVEPEALLGHSVGELVAACLAGVFTLEDALALVALRGRVMQEREPGAMVAVMLAEEELLPLLPPEVSLAAVNGPRQTTASGPEEAVAALERELAARGVTCRRLRTSHAFHSPSMDEAAAEMERAVFAVERRPPRIPFLSNVTGSWITAEEATDPGYWARQLRRPVRFAAGAAALLEGGERVLLEAGPGETLAALVRRQPAARGRTVLSSMPPPDRPGDALDALYGALAGVWSAGAPVAWDEVRRGEALRRVPLPTYPFERRRFWVDPAPAAPAPEGAPPARLLFADGADGAEGIAAEVAAGGPAAPRPAGGPAYEAPVGEAEEAVAAVWSEALGVAEVGRHDDFFELGGNSLIGLQILSRLRGVFDVELPLRTFFEARTPARMAEEIERERALGGEEEAQLEGLLAEIEALSDEELERELAAEEERGGGAPALAGIVPAPAPAPAAPAPGGMRLSLFFFSADGSSPGEDPYRLQLESARFADRHEFTAVWIPERHFEDFGGLYPNPSVVAAALAAVTRRVQLRAGSVVLPLHHPVRVAEEWAVVDRLSGGRAAISCACGWHPHDFVLEPGAYAERKEEMFRRLEQVRRLWSGEEVSFPGPDGTPVPVRTLPRPVQPELPVWITSSGSSETWRRAGEVGANVLAALASQTFDDLAAKVRLYREARRRSGHDPEGGTVTVMLHTFLAAELEEAKERVREPMHEYLRSHLKQRDNFLRIENITPADLEDLIPMAFEHYVANASLIGTPESCAPLLARLSSLGVDEVACLVDFGLDADTVLAGLEPLAELAASRAPRHAAAGVVS